MAGRRTYWLVAGLLGWATLVYGGICVKTHELNPSRQVKWFSAMEKVLGKNGYANKNQDGELELAEKLEVYERMGLKNKIKWKTIDINKDKGWLKYTVKGKLAEFPEPKLKDLERAIQSYES